MVGQVWSLIGPIPHISQDIPTVVSVLFHQLELESHPESRAKQVSRPDAPSQASLEKDIDRFSWQAQLAARWSIRIV